MSGFATSVLVATMQNNRIIGDAEPAILLNFTAASFKLAYGFTRPLSTN